MSSGKYYETILAIAEYRRGDSNMNKYIVQMGKALLAMTLLACTLFLGIVMARASGEIQEDTFKAWINKQPLSGNKLIVTGQIKYPTSGWQAELIEPQSQSDDPATLVLSVQSNPPKGQVLQMLSILKVRFEKTDSHNYKHVTIMNGDAKVTIDVAITQ